jgi:hypothetical protein
LNFSCSNAVIERYYRVDDADDLEQYNGTAELNMKGNTFEIKVSNKYDQNIGIITGKLNKLETSIYPELEYYYSVIRNYSNMGESCIFIFVKKKDESGIRVNIFGDNPNLLEGDYGGWYIGQNYRALQLSKNIDDLLREIFFETYDINKIKEILDVDLEYFIEIFLTCRMFKNGNSRIIEGWIPGGKRYTNGIVMIEDNDIYILFGDIRDENDIKYCFYTNNANKENIPLLIKEWRHFPDNIRIKR